MSIPNQDDNGPPIVESVFREVITEVETKYGPIDEGRARRMLFIVMNDKDSNSFQTALSRAKTIVHVPEMERARYHSLGVRYFKRTNPKKPAAKKAAVDKTNWDFISKLCALEQHERQSEAGEDRLSPDWEPVYEGETWED